MNIMKTIKLPNGTYQALASGYVSCAKIAGYTCEFKFKNGVRGIYLPDTITIAGDSIKSYLLGADGILLSATEIPKVEMVQNYEDVYYVLQYPNGKFARLDSASGGYSYEVGFKNAEKFTIEKAEEYLRVSNRERFVIKKVNTTSVLTTINA